MKQRIVIREHKPGDKRADQAAAPERASDVILWNRETIPFARDMLFIAAILVYMIGFVYQTAKMQWFGINVDLGDQPLTSLFSWAIDALREDPLVYVLTAIAAVGLVAAASVVKHRLAGQAHCRESAYAFITAAIVVAVVGSSWFAWRDGAKKADDYWNNNPKFATYFVFLKNGESQPQLYGSKSAPTPVYILSQTADMYEILLQQPKAPMRTFLVHRADVGLITIPQPQATAPGTGDRYEVTLKKAIATPPPSMIGDS